MGIAAYNRGSRAISAHIDQQLRDAKTVKPNPGAMWRAPAGWFKAACDARQERETTAARIEDNENRRKRGLPTYEV